MKFQKGQLVRNRREFFDPVGGLPARGIIVGLSARCGPRIGEREAMLKIQWFDDNAPSGWFPAVGVVSLSEQ